VVSYSPSGATLLGRDLARFAMPDGPANPSQVPSVIDGNILFGPCTGTYGAPGGRYRRLSCFSKADGGRKPELGWWRAILLSGFMYFHSGNGATCGTNTTCLTMSGGSGAGAFTLGNLVADKLSMAGNSSLNMILNPELTFSLFRPQVLR
jgi:hypothetical protein